MKNLTKLFVSLLLSVLILADSNAWRNPIFSKYVLLSSGGGDIEKTKNEKSDLKFIWNKYLFTNLRY